jgi:hypothetical protein
MILTRRQLRNIIQEAVEQKETNELMDSFDDIFDKAAIAGENFLEDLAKHAIKAGEKAEEEEPIEEAAAWIIAGTAAAMPIIMKGIGHLVKVISKGLQKIENSVGGGASGTAGLYDYEKMGDEWQAWWEDASEDLHHKYINGCEKLVDAYCYLRGINPSKEARQACAEFIWTLIIGFLLYKSGIGLLHAVGHHAYGVAGLEAVLAAIKSGEILAYTHEIFATLLGAAAIVSG